MTLTIKRNHDGDPVCADCGHYFGIDAKAMEVDGELVCWDCLKKWAKDDFSSFMDYFASDEHEILYEHGIEKLAEEDEQEKREAVEAWMQEVMRMWEDLQ